MYKALNLISGTSHGLVYCWVWSWWLQKTGWTQIVRPTPLGSALWRVVFPISELRLPLEKIFFRAGKLVQGLSYLYCTWSNLFWFFSPRMVSWVERYTRAYTLALYAINPLGCSVPHGSLLSTSRNCPQQGAESNPEAFWVWPNSPPTCMYLCIYFGFLSHSWQSSGVTLGYALRNYSQ